MQGKEFPSPLGDYVFNLDRQPNIKAAYTLQFPSPLGAYVFNHSDNVVVILDVINNSLVLVGKIEVNRYFPVLMHPNRFYEFNHNPAVKALNVFVFQKGG